MLRLAADENVKGRIVRALRLREPRLDLVTVQEAGLSGIKDPALLEWAAHEQRVLITSDRKTLVGDAFIRVKQGLPMPGVLLVDERASLGRVIEDLLDVARLSFDGEYEGQVRYLPLR